MRLFNTIDQLIFCDEFEPVISTTVYQYPNRSYNWTIIIYSNNLYPRCKSLTRVTLLNNEPSFHNCWKATISNWIGRFKMIKAYGAVFALASKMLRTSHFSISVIFVVFPRSFQTLGTKSRQLRILLCELCGTKSVCINQKAYFHHNITNSLLCFQTLALAILNNKRIWFDAVYIVIFHSETS